MSMLLAFCHATRLILHNESHQIVLSGQKLIQADRSMRWWRYITTWGLATPTYDRTLRDVEDRVLESPAMHHLS
jgi:hypothetical protein